MIGGNGFLRDNALRIHAVGDGLSFVNDYIGVEYDIVLTIRVILSGLVQNVLLYEPEQLHQAKLNLATPVCAVHIQVRIDKAQSNTGGISDILICGVDALTKFINILTQALQVDVQICKSERSGQRLRIAVSLHEDGSVLVLVLYEFLFACSVVVFDDHGRIGVVLNAVRHLRRFAVIVIDKRFNSLEKTLLVCIVFERNERNMIPINRCYLVLCSPEGEVGHGHLINSRVRNKVAAVIINVIVDTAGVVKLEMLYDFLDAVCVLLDFVPTSNSSQFGVVVIVPKRNNLFRLASTELEVALVIVINLDPANAFYDAVSTHVFDELIEPHIQVWLAGAEKLLYMVIICLHCSHGERLTQHIRDFLPSQLLHEVVV
ncbi:portal protein [Bacteriophage N159_L15121_C59.1]|nr:portal protein [Bacteriophage N159_L15121_C59.1]